jgi:hypothetical protein
MMMASTINLFGPPYQCRILPKRSFTPGYDTPNQASDPIGTFQGVLFIDALTILEGNKLRPSTQSFTKGHGVIVEIQSNGKYKRDNG